MTMLFKNVIASAFVITSSLAVPLQVNAVEVSNP